MKLVPIAKLEHDPRQYLQEMKKPSAEANDLSSEADYLFDSQAKFSGLVEISNA